MSAKAKPREVEVLGIAHAKTNAKIIQVERMSACGLDEPEIAYVLGIDVVTLKLHYQQEIDMGLASVTAKVGGALIKSAMRGDTNAAQFILRSRARWVTPTKIEQDVNLTVEHKRSLIDEITKMYHMGRTPVTLEHVAQVQQLEKAKVPAGTKPS